MQYYFPTLALTKSGSKGQEFSLSQQQYAPLVQYEVFIKNLSF